MKDFKQENIIDKWLEKNGTKEIEKQVENEYKEIMKLEDRFEDAILNDGGNVYQAVNKCVEISNAETIGFNEWCFKNCELYEEKSLYYFKSKSKCTKANFLRHYTITELLKIYQDENRQ